MKVNSGISLDGIPNLEQQRFSLQKWELRLRKNLYQKDICMLFYMKKLKEGTVSKLQIVDVRRQVEMWIDMNKRETEKFMRVMLDTGLESAVKEMHNIEFRTTRTRYTLNRSCEIAKKYYREKKKKL